MRIILGIVIGCFILTTSSWAGIAGYPDKVRANTLIVPFFEVGIDSSTHPHDTLLVVCRHENSGYVHLHVWDIDGNAVDLYQNFTVESGHCEDFSMRALIEAASSSVQEALKVNDEFYRGFVTIDVVTEQTTLSPIDTGYPLGSENSLTGYIYYTRLTEGSSNGLTMVPIEYVGNSLHWALHGFYHGSDGLEEIDTQARSCAAELSQEASSCSEKKKIYKLYGRVFLKSDQKATTRLIVFTWNTDFIGGPSEFCKTHSCDETYRFYRNNKEGDVVEDKTIRLDHVVNVFDISGTQGGYFYIMNIDDSEQNFQVYAFIFNSYNPGEVGGINMNWDAIFEAYIVP